MSLQHGLRIVPSSQQYCDNMRSSSKLYSTTIAPPLSQSEQPFRFLDLPPEIRNMIYQFSFKVPRVVEDSHNWKCKCFFTAECNDYRKAMQLQWSSPLFAAVNKSIRQEVISLYYATKDLNWHWNPMSVLCEPDEYPLTRSLRYLDYALDFVASQNTQVKSITIESSKTSWDNPTDTMVDITNSVRFLAPFSRNLKETGRAHSALHKIHFADESSLAYRLFDHAGSIAPSVLNDETELDKTMRAWLSKDPGASELNSTIKRREEAKKVEIRLRAEIIEWEEIKRLQTIRMQEQRRQEAIRMQEQKRQETIRMHEQEQHRIKMERRWRAKERRIKKSVLVPNRPRVKRS
ncbi:hypothetical protein D6C78_05623 [Aureobasidium pullulans]|uniref:2EXR domain-containing protein n=1 Tax=Aureobasidium pullulans TaxID=5580 RepID=A0A4T0BV87_AURPU|nr:hypothetical protein D6C78_05623 [Aureobasidium pullulans]